jgi:Zn-dependent protease
MAYQYPNEDPSNQQLPTGTGIRRPNELIEFAKAWIGTALAFAVLYSGQARFQPAYYLSSRFVVVFLLTALTAGLGVILHELMHRVVARRFGATAYFVANDAMLLISIVLAFTGFLFAAPGAVWHTGVLTKRQVGLIAAAGPITNMVLALLFAAALIALGPGAQDTLLASGLRMGFLINGILGVFNMLPFGPIDGAKVLNWSGPAFVVLIVIAIGIAFGLPRLPLSIGLPSIF